MAAEHTVVEPAGHLPQEGAHRTVTGIAMLTRAERRVALLAADGLRNTEIASRLVVTVSTVEQHLTRVYRKLRVSGRAHLRRRLAGACSRRDCCGSTGHG